MMTKTFLHVGCGEKHPIDGVRTERTPGGRGFNSLQWREIRFDIDPAVAPDIVGTMTDLRQIPDGSVDAVLSIHNLEHIFLHEVPRALAEFRRVLKPSGFAVICCPDLQAAASLIADDRHSEPLPIASSFPITPMDLLYGWSGPLAEGQHFAAHKSGFTLSMLMTLLQDAGFGSVAGFRVGIEIIAVTTLHNAPAEELEALAEEYFFRR